MGLDCTAYKNLIALSEGEYEVDEDGYPDVGVKFYFNNGYPLHSAGLDPEAVYKHEDAMGWRAGSYSGYSSWRGYLASFAKQFATDKKDFSELINFSDCEGVIGPIISAKLAADFNKNKDFLEDFASKTFGEDTENKEWFVELYNTWSMAFEMAADNGAVSFH